MADITFKEYLEGRSREEMMKNRQKLMEDFKEFKRRQKVKEQRTMAKAGKMMRRLTGGQAKLDRNKNNRIDAQDFKILRAEKAKGRGMGLQDEKLKPGKVKKAALGALVAGATAAARLRKKKIAPAGLGLQGAAMAKLKAMQRILGRKAGGPIIKARKGTIIKPKKPGVLRPKPADRYGQPMIPKPIKPKKKMGGGMMKKGPGYKKGSLNEGIVSIGPYKPKPGGSKPSLDYYDNMKMKKKMGGGMMQRPNMMKAKGGVLVKVKMGKNKPTKMF